ncbi:MAG: hypothetical protein HOV80_29415 [Polyangiaceae bacterium]|nr:hypothetical protein [Polyangiaceae bacterium]
MAWRYAWGCVCVVACSDDAEPQCATAPAAPLAVESPSCDANCGGGDAVEVCPGTCGRQLELEWFLVLDDASCQREPVVAAEVPDLVIVGGGKDDSEGLKPQLWLAGLTPSGCVKWTDTEGTLGDSFVLGVAGDPSSGYYAVGHVREPEESGLRAVRAWIRRYLPNGDIAWTRREHTSIGQRASAVAIDADGGAIVTGGSDGTDPEGSRGWMRRYSADGEPRGEELWLGDGVGSYALDVMRASSGRVWISLWTGSAHETTGWIAGLDDRDQIAWLKLSSQSAYSSRLALLNDSSPVLIEYPNGVSRWSAEGELLWTVAAGKSWTFIPLRAATTSDGRIVVVGTQSSQPAVLIIDADGNLQGLQIVPGVVEGSASDVSVAADGSIYLTGLVQNYDLGACDTWVAKARLD